MPELPPVATSIFLIKGCNTEPPLKTISPVAVITSPLLVPFLFSPDGMHDCISNCKNFPFLQILICICIKCSFNLLLSDKFLHICISTSASYACFTPSHVTKLWCALSDVFLKHCTHFPVFIMFCFVFLWALLAFKFKMSIRVSQRKIKKNKNSNLVTVKFDMLSLQPRNV